MMYETEEDLVRAIALMFFDAKNVICEPDSYARAVIAQVRRFDLEHSKTKE